MVKTTTSSEETIAEIDVILILKITEKIAEKVLKQTEKVQKTTEKKFIQSTEKYKIIPQKYRQIHKKYRKSLPGKNLSWCSKLALPILDLLQMLTLMVTRCQNLMAYSAGQAFAGS